MNDELTIKCRNGATLSPSTLIDVASIARNFAQTDVDRARYTGTRNAATYSDDTGQSFSAHWTRSGRMVVVVDGLER